MAEQTFKCEVCDQYFHADHLHPYYPEYQWKYGCKWKPGARWVCYKHSQTKRSVKVEFWHLIKLRVEWFNQGRLPLLRVLEGRE